MNYQPIYGMNAPYQRDCEERYEIISDLAGRFNRRFSVLDLGANFGWFDFKLMSEFDCTCVLVDNKPVDRLIDEHGDGRAWHLRRHLTGRELHKLARSENFDIVLGLSVLHHIYDFQAAYEGLKGLGRYALIETQGIDPSAANPSRHEDISEMLDGETLVATVKSHLGGTRPIYLVEGSPSIDEQTLDARHRKAPDYGTYKVTLEFDTAEIEIERPNPNLSSEARLEKREYYPGINAHNFALLGGGYPGIESIARKMAETNHPDHHPWNFVLGHGVIPIDTVKKW